MLQESAAQVIEFLGQPAKVAVSVSDRIAKCTDVHLINHGVFEPQRIIEKHVALFVKHCVRWII